MISVLQIAPRVPPAIEGVTATALAIEQAMRSRYGWTGSIAAPGIFDPALRRTGDVGLSTGDAPGLAQLLLLSQVRVVFVHYVNYAYDSQGCPDWLLTGLSEWRALSGKTALWVYFHEIYATGPPWRRSFWAAPRQKLLASKLASISSLCITSLPRYGELLRDLRYSGELLVRPIISTAGEPASTPPFFDRAPSLIVFGTPGLRALAYGAEAKQLHRACEAFEIENIVDIGPGAAAEETFAGRPVRRLGLLPQPALSAELCAARIGFVAYPQNFLEKSSVFAAYCAHGMFPICAGLPRSVEMAPRNCQEYWAAGPVAPSLDQAAAIASRATAWYEQHSIGRLAAELVAAVG